MRRFFSELQRRRVLRVVVAYCAAAFLAVQVAQLYFPPLGLPDWAFRLVAVLSILGLPVAAVLAWIFERTPQGVRRTAALTVDDPTRMPRSAVERFALGGAMAVVALAGAAAVAVRPDERAIAIATVEDVVQLSWEGGIESTPSLSRDGRWLVYSAGGDIYLRSVGGTVAVNLTPDTPYFDGQPAFSPDGSRIAFASRRDGGETAGGIWVIEAAGGPARRLTDRGFAPAWSADGHEVLYVTEYVQRSPGRVRTSALHAVDIRSGAVRVISDGDAVAPAVSPNGRWIAYASNFQPDRAAGCGSIWVMRSDGTDAARITADGCLWTNPVWSADGRYIFAIQTVRQGGTLWRIPMDERTGRATGPPVHVPLAARTIAAVTVAPDGLIVYAAPELQSNIQRIVFDPARETVGNDPTPVTTGTRLWMDVDVARDGRLLMWQFPAGVFVSEPDGTDMLELAPAGRAADRFPRWHPEGDRIAFSSMRSGTMETWTVGADGGHLQRFTHFDAEGAGFFPLWSPDATRLLVTTGADFGGTSYLMRPGAPWEEQRKEPLPPAPGPAELRYRPWSWSPDGRSIAAYSEMGAGLAIFNFDTGGWREIGPGQKPRWLSDSRRLLYVHQGQLMIIDAQSRRSRPLLALPHARIDAAAPGPGDSVIYFILARDEGDLWSARIREH